MKVINKKKMELKDNWLASLGSEGLRVHLLSYIQKVLFGPPDDLAQSAVSKVLSSDFVQVPWHC